MSTAACVSQLRQPDQEGDGNNMYDSGVGVRLTTP